MTKCGVSLFMLIQLSFLSYGQSPELSLREFASGQIKKGVRSIGMGGDGATWGNYSLVYKDSATALIDAGNSRYPNGNSFSFTAVGVTLPAFRHGFSLYVIALSQYASNIGLSLAAPGPGHPADPFHGDGSNQSVFVKGAMPLGKYFSAGILLSYERSQFSAIADQTPVEFARYQTSWAPSGGFGITWQPCKRVLAGFRALFNNDKEKRIDNTGSLSGSNNTQEYRAGVSVGLWNGALLDAGGNVRHRSNQIYGTRGTATEPNIGFEQTLWQRHFSFRFGVDETSGTGGISLRFHPVVMDIAYVHNMASERIGTLFGTGSQSVIGTFLFDFGHFSKSKG